MELKATTLGKRMAQHPYDRVQLLNAGVKVSGDNHEYLIPFNQLLSVQCKRGLVWGELEFVLPDSKVVRLHGTEWNETQRFYHHLNTLWQQWSAEMSGIAAGVLQQQLEEVARASAEGKWLTRQQVTDIQVKIRRALTGLPMPTSRLDAFENCRELWRQCQSWLADTEEARLAHNQAFTESMLEQYHGFFASVETSPLNPAQARAVVNGERALLVLAGAGSGKTSVLVARAGWLLTRGEAAADQILLLAFGRQAAQEMDERIRERLGSEEIAARTFHSLALHIIQQGSKKVPTISKLESDSTARQTLLLKNWRQQCQEKKAQAKGWRQWLEEEMGWQVPDGEFWQDKKIQRRMASRLDRWVSLMRMHGGSQAEMIAGAPEEVKQFSGISRPESWGRWSNAQLGDEVKIEYTHPLPEKFDLVITARAFGPNANRPVPVRVGDKEQMLTLSNDVTTSTLHFDNPTRSNTLVIVPPDPQSTNEGNILGHAPRKLGIGMVEIKIVSSAG